MVDRVGNARQALSVNISQRRPRKIFGIVRVIEFPRYQTHFRWAGKKCGLGSSMQRGSSFPFLFLLVSVFLLRGVCCRVSDSGTRRSFP
jgi:hypothetical protein